MSHDQRHRGNDGAGTDHTTPRGTPGKQTRTQSLPARTRAPAAPVGPASAPGAVANPGAQPAPKTPMDDPFAIHLEGAAGAVDTPSVRDPIVRNAAQEVAQLPGRLAALRKLAGEYGRARDQLDGDSVGVIGLRLVVAYIEAEAALARLNEGMSNADLLGAVGVEYASDPGGEKEQARAEELTGIKEAAADLAVELPALSALLAQAVRPATFRHQPVAGQDDLPHPEDVPAYLRAQTVKTILLLDTVDEIRAMLGGVAGQPPELAAALRKEAANRLQFWLSDRDGFLFLLHALIALGHGDLLGAQGQDGKVLHKTVEAVTRGVPQTVADLVATVREAKGRGLDGDGAGARALLELARERVDELATYEKVKAALPQGTNGLTLDHALFVVQEAREGLREQTRDLQRAGMLGEGLWDLRIRQLDTAGPVLRVLTGETTYGDSPLAAVGPAQKASLIGTGAVASVVIGGAAGAAWISAHAAAVAEVAAGAYATAVITVVRNPYAATALAEFVASLGFNIAEAGGLDNFLESLKTPAGVMQLAMDIVVLKQSMGGGRYGDADLPDAPPRAPQIDEGSQLGAQVRDVLDRARALKAATIEWAKQPRRGGAQQAVTPDGQVMAVPARGGDELPSFSAVYAQQLGDRRAARGARGAQSPQDSLFDDYGRRATYADDPTDWHTGDKDPPSKLPRGLQDDRVRTVDALTAGLDGIYDRPGFRDGTRRQVYDRARADSLDGVVRDPATNAEIPFDSDWQMGHLPGWEFRKHQASAARRNLTREQFFDEYNDVTHYRPETARTNQSHELEAPDHVDHWADLEP